MRNLKRFLAMTLTMLMVVGCFSFASFAEQFEDVYDYTDAIDTLSDIGVIKGYGDGTFGPDDSVARWHMALWIAKLETGKVGDDDLLTIWRSEENYTDFTDVIVDQYIGAINYASDEDIIIGTSASTFEPEAGITYQDALTMVVRALGFGSDAMNAGYPWKYINKANELGLGNGISDVAYTDVLTRGQTAQILYNALFATGADETVYANDVFQLSTIVITGTENIQIVGAETIVKDDYLCFNTLNTNGTINDAVTYHLPIAAFEDVIDTTVPENYVGASFKVTSSDGFKSLDVIIAMPSYTFDNTTISTPATSGTDSTKIVLGEETYNAVTSFSTLYNTQGIKGNTPEILAFATTGTAASGGYAKVDANYNILSEKGDIVAYYMPLVTGSYATPYVQKIAADVYKPVDLSADPATQWDAYELQADKTWKQVTYYVAGGFSEADKVEKIGGKWITKAKNEYAQITGMWANVGNVNAYSTAVAYDDNNDGYLDRVFYTYETFAQFGRDGDGHATFDGVDSGVAGVFVDADGVKIDAPAAGSFIRYSKNAISGWYTIYEVYEVNSGLVSAVTGSTITIGGVTYTLGVVGYPGSGSTDSKVELLGKYVYYVLDGENLVQVYGAANNGKYIVFDNFTGITGAGYATALVYAQDKAASVITIASIDGYSYQNYLLNANAGSLGNVTDGIATGTVFYGTQDALGYWNIQTTGYDYFAPVDAADEITFDNGIANSDSKFFYASGAIKPFEQFLTTSDTLYIVYNVAKDTFYTTKGVPASDAKITINAGGSMIVSIADGYKATFIYVYDGAIEGKTTLTTWAPYDYDAVIYVDSSVSESVTTDIGTGSILGQVYKYGNVLDMISGNYISVYSGGVYNKRLQPGKFYTVKNGYVEDEVVTFTKESPIQEGLLTYASRFKSLIQDTEGFDLELSALTYLYSLNSSKNVVKNDDGSTKNSVVAAGAYYTYVPVYFYAGENASSRVILQIDATANILTPVKDKKPVYLTATGAGTASNSFDIGKNAYEILTAINPKLEDRTVNENTYDKWMRIYGADGELKNWSIDFTTVTESVFAAPVYTMTISRVFNEYDPDNDAVKGPFTILAMYNGQIYTLFVNLDLAAAPTFLAGINATIYNVDAFKGPVTLPSGGWINSVNDAFDRNTGILDLSKVDFEDVWDELELIDGTLDEDDYDGDYDVLPIYVGQDGIMDTGRFYLTGVEGAALDNTYDVQIFVRPTTAHVEEAHGELYVEPYSDRALATYEQIFDSPVTFNNEGEAVVDIPGLYNMLRVFECSYEGCGHRTILTKDQYIYIIRVGSADNGEWVTLVEGVGAGYESSITVNGVTEDIFTVVDEDAIVFAPDWNVRVYASLLGDVGTIDVEDLTVYDSTAGANYTTKPGGRGLVGLTFKELKLARTAEVVAFAYGRALYNATIDPTNTPAEVAAANAAINTAIAANVGAYSLQAQKLNGLNPYTVTIALTTVSPIVYTVTFVDPNGGTATVTVDGDNDVIAVTGAANVAKAVDPAYADAFDGTVYTADVSFTARFNRSIISAFGVPATLGVDDAAIIINLNETQALNNFAWPSTTMTLLGNNVRYNGWGAESITYNLVSLAGVVGFNTPVTTGALSATNIAAAATGFGFGITTNKNTFNNTVIFDNAAIELCKNFAITYTGIAYKSFAGTTTFPTFNVKQVLPFEPYYYDVQFGEYAISSDIESQIFWISENLGI